MRHIVGALFYLRAMTLVNAVRSRVLRLKQPKYLAGAIVGVAYLYFAFGRRVQSNRSDRVTAMNLALTDEGYATALLLGAAIVLIMAMLCWLWPRSRAALNFSEAEIAFLFPAPLTRATVVHYRMIDGQLRLIFTSLILAFVSGLWGFTADAYWQRLIAWWLIFATLWLHVLGSSFVISRLLDRGVTTVRRLLVTLVVLVLLLGGSAVWTWNEWRAPTDQELSELRDLASYAVSMIDKGALSLLLWPCKWLVAPLLAADTVSFLRSLLPAVAIYGVHYIWVLRSEVTFEEGSIAKAARRAARVAEYRSGKVRFGKSQPKARRAPFNLEGSRRVELAFVWKNLLGTAAFLSPRSLLLTGALGVGLAWWCVAFDHMIWAKMIGTTAIVGAGYIAVFGPLLARQDLRSDLLNVDILKVYPLRGWQVVLGQILAPAFVVTMLLWIAMTIALVALPTEGLPLVLQHRQALLVCAIGLIIPLLCTVQILVLNAAALLFPAWIETGRQRAQGIDVLGQRILFLAGLLIAMAGAFLPAIAIASISFGVVYWMVDAVLAAWLALLVMVGVLLAEIALAIAWLGKRFEVFDLSAELRP
jgi:ABC-2 type transport system permease protein